MSHANGHLQVKEFLKTPLHNYKLLTLTFRYDFHTLSCKELYDQTVWELCKNMHRISPEWRAYPELTNKGMLHWHIILRTTNFVKLKAFRGWWSRRYGSSHCEPIKPTMDDFMCTWFYIRKDSREMMKILKIKKPMLINPSTFSYERFKRIHDAKTARDRKLSQDLDHVSTHKENMLSRLLIRDDLASPKQGGGDGDL